MWNDYKINYCEIENIIVLWNGSQNGSTHHRITGAQFKTSKSCGKI